MTQGEWVGVVPGDPAFPDFGSFLRVNPNGIFTTLAAGLDRPSSLEVIGNTAYYVTFDGEIWTIR